MSLTKSTNYPKPVVVIYHANCLDGMGAVWAAREFFKHLDVEVSYIPMNYSDELDMGLVKGKTVYLLDFSFKRDVVETMIKETHSLSIIDHHKTAHEELGDIFYIDQSKSGAVLAWEYFHPDKEIPKLLLHIQDRDLWKFELEGTKEITAYLYSKPMTYDEFDKSINTPIKTMVEYGKVINDFLEFNAKKMLGNKQKIELLCKMYYVVNCNPMFASLVGHYLAELYGVGITYHDISDKRIYSLRSIGDVDVSLIAKEFGGGGHKNAAGFTWRLATDTYSEDK